MDWQTILSVLLGGLITIGASWIFYVRASKELWREAQELKQQNTDLRRLNGLTIRILEEANLLPENVETMKDKAGNHTGGLRYKLVGEATVGASASADLKVIRRKEQSEPTGEEPINKPAE